ncbi:MAG: hypothetical protein K9N07_05790 [Candidatus Cloacimonetes bacterium]|nr:hypothetical protein [Candidatus Cloacimonadota bacterium]
MLDKINSLIGSEYKMHPKSQLVDYYKLFFQGTFGPGHIIKNLSSAKEFLLNELKNASTFEAEESQNISFINKFYRVNINVINKGLLTFEDFFTAFINSAELANEPTYEKWIEYWNLIEKQISKTDLPMTNLDVQSAALWKLIKMKQNLSHSDIYRKEYDPHYRLIQVEIYDKIKLQP